MIKKNNVVRLFSGSLSQKLTVDLVLSCRKEDVTVNSALITAFLISQYKIQGNYSKNSKIGVAVSLRNRLKYLIGETFGFYAASITIKPKYEPKKDFWELTKHVQELIERNLEDKEIFKKFIVTDLEPSFMDSLYFCKYGLIKSRLSKIFLKNAGWDRISYEYALTNLGRIDIPTEYGPHHLKLETLFGPSIYSDSVEKIIGICTFNDKLTYVFTYNEAVVDSSMISKLSETAINQLEMAI
jgi:NRPS condensation-like uncharacterized protein